MDMVDFVEMFKAELPILPKFKSADDVVQEISQNLKLIERKKEEARKRLEEKD